MKILKSPTRAELFFKNSRFVAEAVPVTSPEAARAFWRAQAAKYDNGGHIVYAFITGPQGNIMGCSDDGEPSGTAGRPTLAVLKGSGITNCIITTARWFGGTKLGTGGLVHAYSECAKAALAEAETAELRPCCHVTVTLPYARYEQAKILLAAADFVSSSENFSQAVQLAGDLPEANFSKLQQELQNLTGNPETIGKNS